MITCRPTYCYYCPSSDFSKISINSILRFGLYEGKLKLSDTLSNAALPFIALTAIDFFISSHNWTPILILYEYLSLFSNEIMNLLILSSLRRMDCQLSVSLALVGRNTSNLLGDKLSGQIQKLPFWYLININLYNKIYYLVLSIPAQLMIFFKIKQSMYVFLYYDNIS